MGPKLFTCPKCRHTYLGHDPLPDCPRCGYDYREREGFRWDVVVYLLSILALGSFLLVASSYRTYLGGRPGEPRSVTRPSADGEGGPSGPAEAARPPFDSPYHRSGR